MNTENMIEVTGVSLESIVKAAYDLSAPQGLGLLHCTQGPLTDEEVTSIVSSSRDPEVPLDMDYVKGRSVKLFVIKSGDRLYIDKPWYDHSEHQLSELCRRIFE